MEKYNFINISQAKKLTGLSYFGSINISAKLIKNQIVSKQLTYIVYMSPADLSGYNVCSHCTIECKKRCLAFSGRSAMDILSGNNIIQKCRIKKTRLFFEQRDFCLNWIIAEINYYKEKAKKLKYGFSIRLNGTSDINYNEILINGKSLFEIFPDVQFYDYTKNPNKFINKPINYHLTFSYSGRNLKHCLNLLNLGYNIAVVFSTKKKEALPEYFLSHKVINGDLTDYRPADENNCIVGLRYKKIADKVINENIKTSKFVVTI